MRLAILMTFGLALAACTLSPGATGQASHSAATPTASATASPTPNTSPFPTQTPGPTTPRPVAVTCSSQVPTGLRELALVTLRKTAGVVVRDITDIAHPVTRCVFTGPANFFRFVSATRISYMVTADNGDGALYLVDLQTQTTSLARAWTNEGSLYWVYAWS